MLNAKIETELNNHVNIELWSAYLYLAMSNHLAAEGLTGFARWMRKQYEEETTHAMKIVDYILGRGGKVELKTINAVPNKWETVLAMFKQSLAHEQKVTSLINKLVDLSIAEKDHATNNMLIWFVNEQVEEESTATTIVEQLTLIDGNGLGIYMMDKELGKRVSIDHADLNQE